MMMMIDDDDDDDDLVHFGEKHALQES